MSDIQYITEQDETGLGRIIVDGRFYGVPATAIAIIKLEREYLRQQLAATERLLAESLARENVRIEALRVAEWFVAQNSDSLCNFLQKDAATVRKASKMPSDSTALDAALKASYELGRQQMQLSCDMERDDAIANAKREENEACAKLCEVMGNNGYSGGWSIAKAIRSSLADELKGGEQG